MTAIPVVVPNVAANEAAFLLDSGDTVIVGFSQRPMAPGAADVVLVVATDVADPGTGERTESLPRHLCTVPVAGLGDGTIALADVTASEQAAACVRASSYLAGRRVLEGLPIAGS